MQNNPNKVVLSTAYFPPVSYFEIILKSKEVFIEQHENYTKQTYRNRCEILSPGGVQTLSIPVIKKSGEKQKIKDVKIDYKNNWQKQHLKSIQTAYRSSPFFEFYIDAFMPFFEKKHTFLFDFNLNILKTLLKELEINKEISFTEEFISKYNFPDYRNIINPKKKEPFGELKLKEYTQVFFDKFDFIRGLSILDLLFNEGPNTENLLY